MHDVTVLEIYKPCCKAPTSHFGRRLGGGVDPTLPHCYLNSGNIKTSQDAINFPGNLKPLEAQDVWKICRKKADRQDANRRTQYNPQGDRTGRTWSDSMRVQKVRCADGCNYNRQLYFPRHSLYKISLFTICYHFFTLSSVTSTSVS